jgi:hypothetical protein
VQQDHSLPMAGAMYAVAVIILDIGVGYATEFNQPYLLQSYTKILGMNVRHERSHTAHNGCVFNLPRQCLFAHERTALASLHHIHRAIEYGAYICEFTERHDFGCQVAVVRCARFRCTHADPDKSSLSMDEATIPLCLRACAWLS